MLRFFSTRTAYLATTSTLLVAAAALTPSALADDFYRGKKITMTTHTGPGGEYDALLRLLSRHYGRHIPGTPAIIVVNQPGAGGLLSLNHAALRAPQDGTWLTLVSQGLILHEALEKPGVEVSLKKFKWIGNLSSSNNVTATVASFRRKDHRGCDEA